MIFKPSLFLENIVRFLMPFFLGLTVDVDVARAEILETLACYGIRTRSEMLRAAQIVAFGMSALDTLEEAKAAEMSPSMRLRFRGCANGLNRSGQRHEASLAKSLACDAPEAAEPMQEPIDDVPDPEVEAMLEEARANIANCHKLLAVAAAANSPLPVQTSNEAGNRPVWGGEMLASLKDMGLPVGPAAAKQQRR
jgi:hypothetical protein